MKPYHAYSDDEIARYVLGLDMPERTADIQARLAHDDAAAARALKWEAYFLGIVDALPAQAPPDAVLARIRQSLDMDLDLEESPVMGETRAGSAKPRPASGNKAPPTHARQGRRLRRGRLALVIGIGAALCLAALVLWAGLRPPPAGTIILQPLQLESR